MTRAAERVSGRKGRWQTASELVVLCGFAFAQPFFEVVSDTPEYFSQRDIVFVEAAVFGVLLVAVPPGLLLAAEAMAQRMRESLRRRVHLGIVFVLGAIIACQVLDRISARLGEAGGGRLAAVATLVAAVCLGALFALALERHRPVADWIAVLLPAPLVFLALFLFDAPRLGDDVRAAEVRTPAPVVVVVLDELPTSSLIGRDGRLDGQRYPGFAALADTSTWYRNATTIGDATGLAVPSILSGRRPQAGTRPDLGSYPDSLLTLLSASHDFNVVEPITALCPASRCETGGSTLSRIGRLADDAWRIDLQFTAPDRVEGALPEPRGFETEGRSRGDLEDFLSRLGPSDKPLLGFAHLVLPHHPWVFLPDGGRYVRKGDVSPLPSGFRDPDWVDDRRTVQIAWQRHLLQVGYLDGVLQRIVRRLRTTGLFDHALVVVAADHGISFRPGRPGRQPTVDNLADIAAVPLFVKLPEQRRGAIVDGVARTVDVLPTIGRELGVAMPAAVDGRALPGPEGLPDAPVRVDSFTGRTVTLPLGAVLEGRRKTVERQVKLFGSGRWGRVFDLAPAPPGFPVDVAGLTARGLRSVPARIDQESELHAFDPSSGYAPAFVSGRLLDDSAGDERLVLVVNGRVEALITPRRQDGELRFASMIDPARLRSGRNDVSLYRR